MPSNDVRNRVPPAEHPDEITQNGSRDTLRAPPPPMVELEPWARGLLPFKRRWMPF